MIFSDERTPEQHKTMPYLVIGTDNFLSGWGGAKWGKSYAAWACSGEDVEAVLRWVEARKDMSRVRVVREPYRPKGCVHLHIYVARACNALKD